MLVWISVSFTIVLGLGISLGFRLELVVSS